MKSSHKTALALLAGAALGALAVQGLHAQAKPPVYLVSLIDVSNVDAYTKEYVPKVRATITAAGGKLLAASQKVTLAPPRSVMNSRRFVTIPIPALTSRMIPAAM